MKSICLNMIVRNEKNVIERCLNSVKELIDYWVIVDTGSTDGTQSIIQHCLSQIPGELHERVWVDFGRNRNEALDLARNKTDYILFIDADERLVFTEPLNKSALNKDYYLARMIGKNVDFRRILLIKNHFEWKWEGALHEFINNPLPIFGEMLSGVINEYNHVPGCRALDPNKSLKDIEILKSALLNEPYNARYVFYLAQTYASAGQREKALTHYEKRIAMGEGNTPMTREELFWSIYQMGCIQSDLKLPAETVIDTFLKAHQFDKQRAEPLYRLAIQFQMMECYILGYLIIKEALSLPIPSFFVRLQRSVYDYLLQQKLAEFAYLLGNIEESKREYAKLAAIKNIPSEIKWVAEENLSNL